MQGVEIPQNAVFSKWMHPASLRGRSFHEFNWKRTARYGEIRAATQIWSEEEIKGFLSDHGEEGKPSRTSICRHHAETANTVASVLIYPERRSLELCLGHPCSAEYKMVSL